MKKQSIIITLIVLFSAIAILAIVMSCHVVPPAHIAAGPQIRFSSELLNPDEEKLTIYLPEVDMHQVLSWRVEILEPHPSTLLFYDWVGRGQPPSHIVWDGRNSGGEWVDPALDYPVVYYVSDIFGHIMTIESVIPIDVFKSNI